MASKYDVAGDQYRSIDRKIRDIKRQLDQKGGSPLNPDAVDIALQLILEGELPKPLFKRDMRKERGHELVKEGPQHSKGVRVRDLKLQEPLSRDENHIKGEKLQYRATKLNANLGQHTAEYLLEHQEEIPKEWQGTYLVFPGTIWRSSGGPGGFRYVPYLNWDGGQWVLLFFWLDSWFGSQARFVCLNK